MVLLFGGSGYVGRAFARELVARGTGFVAPSHREVDLLSEAAVREAVRAVRPEFVINAVGFTGRPNIDGTEKERLRCLQANTVVPGVLARVLEAEGVRWGHVSSGCIFDGTRADGEGFTEEDAPNFAFRHAQASWYSRTKAMAEILVSESRLCTVWRLRIPFDEFDNPRNYISKILRYERLLDVTNSISHLGDFARACVESLVRPIPPGIYNVTNPGRITTREVAEAVRRHGLTDKAFEFFESERDFLAAPGRVKRASCVLSCEKIQRAGIPIRGVHEALEATLAAWKPA